MSDNQKQVVILGAAGGIGTSLCALLAESGWSVVLAGRDQSRLEALAAMHAKVEKLKAKADHCRDALDALVEQAKADILAHTGKDLKTLKLDAARAESALRDKADELERRRDTSDADTLETLNSELDALQEHAQLTRLALKTAVEEQGLVEE